MPTGTTSRPIAQGSKSQTQAKSGTRATRGQLRHQDAAAISRPDLEDRLALVEGNDAADQPAVDEVRQAATRTTEGSSRQKFRSSVTPPVVHHQQTRRSNRDCVLASVETDLEPWPAECGSCQDRPKKVEERPSTSEKTRVATRQRV